MKRRLILGAGLWIAFSGAGAWPAAGHDGRYYGGTVLHFRPPASNYRLMRAGKTLPVSIFMVLEPADELRVLAPSASLTIKDGELPPVTLRSAASPYIVKGQARRTRVKNLAAILLAKLMADDVGLPIDGGARGDELRLPFDELIAGTSILDARSGPFFAAWNGGVPPYRFLLKSVDGPVLIDEQNLENGRLAITSRQVVLRPGFWRMEVRDGKGAVVLGRFEVRSAVAASLPRDQDIADAVQLFDATALAVEQQGRQFEAFQRLAGLRKRRPEAAKLANWLAAGDAFSDGLAP